MKTVLQKLNSSQGESLMETLTSILIICLAGALFATMAMASSRMNASARSTDVSFYEGFSEAEAHVVSGTSGSVTVAWSGGSQSYSVDYAGDSLRSFSVAGGGG